MFNCAIDDGRDDDGLKVFKALSYAKEEDANDSRVVGR